LKFDSLNAIWNRNKFWIILSLLVVLILYPLSFFQHIPKWDSVRGYLPYRFFVSDYLGDGHLPLWNPFQRLGYPGYSDLQSGCWYPVVWLLMLLGQYDITSLIVEVVLTFLIAAWGMFRFSTFLFDCKRTSLLLAISYGLSGFMVGSAQLLVFLIGMAWLPWILWAWLSLLRGASVRHALLLSFFLAFNITGASPAYTIILLYLMPAIGFYYIRKSENKRVFLQGLMKPLAVMFVMLFLLLLPFIVSFIDFMPYFNRTGKLPFEAITLNPYTIGDYISFLFPYSVISTGQMFQLTDLSLRNSYVGLVCFAFFLITLSSKKYRTRWYWPLVGCLVFSMWLAFGSQTFLYRWVYNLPGFGLFRHPSFFRGYAIFCIIALAGFSIRKWLEEDRSISPVFFRRALLALLAISLIALVAAGFRIQNTVIEIFQKSEFPAQGFWSQLFISSIVLLLLSAFVYFIRKRYQLNLFWSLLLFVSLDLLVQTRLTAPTTLYHGVDYDETAQYFERIEELPLHQQRFNGVPMKLLDESRGLLKTPFLETNISTYNRTVSSVGENPFRFKAFDVAKDNGMLEWALQNPLMYFPTRICLDGDTVSPGCIFQSTIHLDNVGDECNLREVTVGFNNYSTVINNPTEDSRWLVLTANYHHHWHAELNGTLLPIERVNGLCMGVLVPPQSTGQLVFTYESKPLLWAIGVSFLGWCLAIYLLLNRRAIQQLEA
jgi:hypothetical protein